jgi:hypothetical protein
VEYLGLSFWGITDGFEFIKTRASETWTEKPSPDVLKTYYVRPNSVPFRVMRFPVGIFNWIFVYLLLCNLLLHMNEHLSLFVFISECGIGWGEKAENL